MTLRCRSCGRFVAEHHRWDGGYRCSMCGVVGQSPPPSVDSVMAVIG